MTRLIRLARAPPSSASLFFSAPLPNSHATLHLFLHSRALPSLKPRRGSVLISSCRSRTCRQCARQGVYTHTPLDRANQADQNPRGGGGLRKANEKPNHKPMKNQRKTQRKANAKANVKARRNQRKTNGYSYVKPRKKPKCKPMRPLVKYVGLPMKVQTKEKPRVPFENQGNQSVDVAVGRITAHGKPHLTQDSASRVLLCASHRARDGRL